MTFQATAGRSVQRSFKAAQIVAARLADRGPITSRKLYWFQKRGVKNFGDEVGPYLFSRISGGNPEQTNPLYSLSPVFMSAGSILHRCSRMAVVWGSGMLTADCSFPPPLTATAVRGPLTADRFHSLGYEVPEVLGDPALLLPLFCAPSNDKRYEIGVIPNYIEIEYVKDMISTMSFREAVTVIEPLGEVEDIVHKLTSCQVLLASSLHGWIVGNAYGIPTAWIRSSDKVVGDGSKYIDYHKSVGIERAVALNWKNIGDSTVEEVVLRVKSFEQPDLPDLDALLDACPFPRPDR